MKIWVIVNNMAGCMAYRDFNTGFSEFLRRARENNDAKIDHRSSWYSQIWVFTDVDGIDWYFEEIEVN